MKFCIAGAFALALLAWPAHANDIGNSTWSENANSNTAAPPDGWPSGVVTPVEVSPMMRETMAAIKRWYNHINDVKTTGGNAVFQTLTYDVAPAAYVDGDAYTFVVGTGLTNTGSVTLNVNGLGAVTVLVGATPLAAGQLVAGQVYTVYYKSAGPSFQLLGTPEKISAARTLRGNPTSASAIPRDITLGTNLAFSGDVLNATGGGGGGDCGSGTLNMLMKFTGTLTCGDSDLFEDGTVIRALNLPLDLPIGPLIVGQPPGTVSAASAAVASADPGTATYVPLSVLTLEGGIARTYATFQIATTEAISGAVDVAGTGGTPGSATVTTTTGTGTAAQFTVTIGAGGGIASVDAVLVAGSFTVNPTDITHEPVTGGGLIGAQLAIGMWPSTVSLAAGGEYLTIPSDPVVTVGGGGSGAKLNVTWTGDPLPEGSISAKATGGQPTYYENGVAFRSKYTPPNVAGTFTPDMNLGWNFKIVLDGLCPCTINNPLNLSSWDQRTGMFVVDTVNASGTIGTWGTAYRFAWGEPPVTSAGGIDYFSYYVDGNAIVLSPGIFDVQAP